MLTRAQIVVRGIVQGVGFRPFIYSLANRSGLRGTVLNDTSGVLIDVEGDLQAISYFTDQIRISPPPLSVIDSIEARILPYLAHFEDFRIIESIGHGKASVPVSPDIATCEDCLRELFDPQNRRYRYPFINCTNCGPRFTIIEGIPYDRVRTTMREFEMCKACRSEYEDPSNRRFHAEPTCCPECGPRVFLVSANEGDLSGKRYSTIGEGGKAIELAKKAVLEGNIVAVKGLGGYHLVCDALNREAVISLRKRKYRDDKPFALMAASVKIAKNYCHISKAEKELLESGSRPVVLLERRRKAEASSANYPDAVPAEIAPGVGTLGFMLPYTPLHHLLLEGIDHPFVMTSGNISDEPICYVDDDAFGRLKPIADLFLLHDRRIHIRTDDSVVRLFQGTQRKGAEQATINNINIPDSINSPKGKIAFIRRSRGFAPFPVRTTFNFARQILACGAELKNTFCIARDCSAYVSHHIGDLENLETLRSFTEGIEHFKRLFDLDPKVVAYDLHPEYLSTKYALSLDDFELKIGIQHHHAHIASCIVDNEADGEVIGVAMDGLGFGTDGRLWGGEFFIADLKHAERIAHLDNIPMPGGTMAIREPWRMAAAYLQKTFGDEFPEVKIPFVRKLDLKKWAALRSMIASGTNSPETSSMGRLFDAVSAILDIRSAVNYEGQAAIELESVAETYEKSQGVYEFALANDGIISAEPVIRDIVNELLDGRPTSEVSSKFHFSVACLIAKVALQARDELGIGRVALSGGVFQNRRLLASVSELLASTGFEVLTHGRVPTNDGGISLGQAAIANAKMAVGDY